MGDGSPEILAQRGNGSIFLRVNTLRDGRAAAHPNRASQRSSCVVCGELDERALATLKLIDGSRVFVCGTHDLIYRRSGETASTIEELVAIAKDRRERSVRRDVGDELGARLTSAFSADRRSGQERRR